MKTQGKRCISILLTVILTLQMMFVSGITVFADGTETPIVPVTTKPSIKGLSLILSGEIGLTYHVYVPRKYRDGVMVLEFMDEKPITMNITDCKRDDSTNLYMATYYLSAIELSEPVTLSVYAADDFEHEDPLARASYSAEEYVALLKDDKEATEKEKNVGITLIKYGHYAQLACSEANGWEIGKDYKETICPTDDELRFDASVFKDYTIEWQKHSETVNHLAMSLRLDYKTGIHLYFPLEEKPTVTVNGEAVEVTESERLENNYEIFIEGINALNLEDKYEITVNDATFTLSAFSYCNLAVQHNTSQNTIDAMRALYEFYQATVDYQTSKGA